MNILITGATGFIGSHVADYLSREPGVSLYCLARKQSDIRHLVGLQAKIIYGDITDGDSLKNLKTVGPFQEVYHLAGKLGEWGILEEFYQRLHVQGTENLIQALDPRDLRLFVLFSSPSVVGPSRDRPWNEEDPYAPTNAYERTKAAAETLLRGFAGERKFPFVIIRPEFVYGPRDRHVLELVRAIRDRRFCIIGKGENLLQPTYIADVVQGLDLVRKSPGVVGQTFHIAGREMLTLNKLTASVAQVLGMNAPRLRVPKTAAWLAAGGCELCGVCLKTKPVLTRQRVRFFTESHVFSIEKANKELGYAPRFYFQEGIRLTIDWYRQNGWL